MIKTRHKGKKSMRNRRKLKVLKSFSQKVVRPDKALVINWNCIAHSLPAKKLDIAPVLHVFTGFTSVIGIDDVDIIVFLCDLNKF